ncbi:hypothetical protein N9Q18_01690 [bacterium]|jgi:hypothetical protein|nr:hypothetical protein [bacterium]
MALQAEQHGDREAEIALWARGAQAGDATCMNQFGYMLLEDGNLDMAIPPLQGAAHLGIGNAAYNLAAIFADRDLDRAEQYCLLAIELDVDEAPAQLAELRERRQRP